MGSKSTTFAALAAALFLAVPVLAHSAGLGRLTVLSPLGRPLNAEIELVSQPGEQDLVARLAAPEAFSRAGIELNPALLGARFNIERRNGRQIVRVTTTQPVNEPFLDLLVDLQWNSGRLLREYTVLLDPPEFRSRQAIAAAPPPAVASQPAPPPVKPEPVPEAKSQPAPAPVEPKPVPKPQAALEAKPIPPEAPPAPAPAEAATPPSAAPAPAAAPPASEQPPTAPPASAPGGTYEVKKGDTLGAIARKNLPPGVSLSQMLIALYRANEDAFIQGNVNLVRAGRILNIPDAEGVGTVDREAADRLVKEHQAQFSEYRSRLAAVAAPAEAAAGQRDATGRIEPKPEPAPPAAQDEVRLSKADPQKPATAGARAASEDDRVARERELREAQSRVADLEKNVSDLQKLLEMKNQQLAELEKKAGAQAAAPPAAPLAPAPTKPAAKAAEKPAAENPAAEVPKPKVEAPKPPAEAPKPIAEAPKPSADAPPPAAPKAAEKPAAEAPKMKPKPRPAPPPAPERGLLDDYLEDPMFVGGLGLVVLLLVGYGLWSWRRKKAAQAKFHDSVLGAAAAGAAAGAAADTGMTTGQAAASQATESHAPAGMGTEEVDPIAEADVYVAYGRDAQAEEILKEALQKDPSRVAVHAKLLEIYANRKDLRSFEQTALKLKNVTNGSGAEWERATALGRSIDPHNGLYGGGEASPGALAGTAGAAATIPTLDFDLGGSSQGSANAPDISLDDSPREPSGASAVDIDLGTTGPAAGGAAAEQEKTMGSIDFNLDMGDDKALAAPVPAPSPPAADSGLDFDLKLDDLPSEDSAPAADKPPATVDLGTINLDLGASEETTAAAQGSTDPKWQEVATKLDLAKAYEEMGDKDGARELLGEVMKDGDAAQQGEAQQLLAKLA